jgi:hypothetical protein
MIQVIQACWRRRQRLLTARPALLMSLSAFGAVTLLPTSGLTQSAHLALSKEVVSGRFGQRLPQIIARVRPESLSSHAELSVGLPGLDTLYSVSAVVRRSDHGTFAIDSLVITPQRYVSAGLTRIPLRVLLTVDATPVDSAMLTADLSLAKGYQLIAEKIPGQLILGSKNEIRAKVQASIESVGDVPVKGTLVSLRLPEGGTVRATSDETGAAIFTDVILRGVPGRRKLTFAAGGVVDSSEVTVVVGSATAIKLRVGGAQEFHVWRPFTLSATLTDALGNPTRDKVTFAVDGADGTLAVDNGATHPQLFADANERGIASLTSVRYFGPTGPIRLIAEAGGVADSVSLVVRSGPASKVRLIQEPSTDVIADSMFEVPPMVRVEDVAGNPVANSQVLTYLWQSRPTWKGCQSPNTGPIRPGPPGCDRTIVVATRDRSQITVEAFLKGTTRRVSDTLGVVRFDSLRLIGPDDFYRLEFRRIEMSPTDTGTFSSTIRYDSDRAYNRNFVIVSAIRSIAGSVTPPDEFFDVRFRFRFFEQWDAIIQSDLSIVRRTAADTDSVHTNTKRLVDASALLNWTPSPFRIKDRLTDVPERNVFAGAQLRIFSTVPYVGVHIGELELARSLFHGSMFTAAWLVPLQLMPVKVDNDVFRPSRNNLALDAFLRSSGFDFLKYLNIRGTVLVPLEKGRRTASRIVLAVPVGGLIPF